MCQYPIVLQFLCIQLRSWLYLNREDGIPIQPSLVLSTVEVELSIVTAFHVFRHSGWKYGCQYQIKKTSDLISSQMMLLVGWCSKMIGPPSEK